MTEGAGPAAVPSGDVVDRNLHSLCPSRLRPLPSLVFARGDPWCEESEREGRMRCSSGTTSPRTTPRSPPVLANEPFAPFELGRRT